MAKSIDDLRALVKERLDDTSHKNDGVNMLALIGAAACIITSLISCNRDIIFNSCNRIVFLSALFTLALVSFANFLYYIEIRDLIRKDKASISTFDPNPFIVDNLVKGFLLILILLSFNQFGKSFVNHWQLDFCVLVASMLLGFEGAAISFKRKFKQKLFPIFIGMVILPALLSTIALIWILPGVTQWLDFEVIQFSLSVTAGVGLLYYVLYLYFLSPKTQLNIKLRTCYNRLISRDSLNLEEEEKKVYQIVNGVTFGELFLPNIEKFVAEREQIIQYCSQAYELLDFRNDYSEEAIEKIHKARNLITGAHCSLKKLSIAFQRLLEKIDTELEKLPKREGNLKQVSLILEKLKCFKKGLVHDYDTIKIVIDLCYLTIDDFYRHYQSNKDCLCKYAPYKKRFGHFIGCRVIPTLDKLFHKRKRTSS